MKNNSFYLETNDPKENQKKRIPTNIKVPAEEYNKYRSASKSAGPIKIGDRFRMNDKTGEPGQTGLFLEVNYVNLMAQGKNRRVKFDWVYCRLT